MKLADASGSPLPPTRPMESHHPPKIYSLHTLRHPSCLTEIPSYTALGHIPFDSNQSGHCMAWFDEGPCGSHVFRPAVEEKPILRGRNQDDDPHELSPAPASQIRLADGGCNNSLLSFAGVFLLCIQSLSPKSAPILSYVYLRQPMKRADLAASTSRFRHSWAFMSVGMLS
jgi:hypothetical protein